MGIRPQWTRRRTVGVAVAAALVLISFLSPGHALCPTGHDADHVAPAAVVSVAPAGDHGCQADHWGQTDVRADRAPVASRGADAPGFAALPEAMPAVPAVAPVSTTRTRRPRHGRGPGCPGRALLVGLCRARS